MEQQNLLMDIRERIVRVETKLDNHNGLRERVDVVEDRAIENESRGKSNSHRIDKLEENNTWLWRTIVGAIIGVSVAAFTVFK